MTLLCNKDFCEIKFLIFRPSLVGSLGKDIGTSYPNEQVKEWRLVTVS